MDITVKDMASARIVAESLLKGVVNWTDSVNDMGEEFLSSVDGESVVDRGTYLLVKKGRMSYAVEIDKFKGYDESELGYYRAMLMSALGALEDMPFDMRETLGIKLAVEDIDRAFIKLGEYMDNRFPNNENDKEEN